MCGKGSQTTSSQSAPNPVAMQNYQNLLNRAGNVAQLPFQSYGGEFVAPINQQQQTGIGNINANAGFAQPFIQQGAAYANQAAQPITGAQIAGFQSPYTQQVVNATEAQFNNQNAQQLNQVRGNAAAQGALGGDREAVAEAITAGQQQTAQAPVIAGLYNQGYNTALSTALHEQQNLGLSAYSLGNLGVAGQNAALTGANAQVGAGTLQQSTQQAQDQALYNQFLAEQGFPYQQTQWLAGIDTGVGSQMGGTSSTTGPPPNQTGQYLGLGVAALGLLNRGGGVHRDSGGRIRGFQMGGTPYAGGSSYIPTMGITAGQGAPRAPGLPGQNSQGQPDPFKLASSTLDLEKKLSGLGGSGSTFGGINYGRGDWGGDLGGSDMAGAAQAGVESGLSFDPLTGDVFARGGRIRGFAYGGGDDSFDDRFAPVYGQAEREERALGLGDVTGTYPVPGQDVPMPRPRPSDGGGSSSGDYVNPLMVNGQPQNLTGDIIPPGGTGGGPSRSSDPRIDYTPRDDGVAGAGAAPVSYAPQPSLSGYAPVPGTSGAPAMPQTEEKRKGFGLGFNPLGLSDNARQGLLAAGLGMMASRSPFLGVAVGEGGLAGLQAYSGAKKEEFNENQAVEKLHQSAKQASDRLDMESKRLAQQEEDRKENRALRLQVLEQGKTPPGYERVEGGLRALPGGPADPEAAGKLAGAKKGATGVQLPDEAWQATGDEFLKYLPASDREFVKKISNYEIDPKTLSVVGGHRENALKMASQYDPGFDQKTYNQRYQAIQRFTTGPQGNTVRSLNVAIDHLGTLEDLGTALHNNDVQAVNRISNYLTTQFGTPAVTNFNLAKSVVADEVLKSVLGSGAGSQYDREELQRQFSAANSPAQLVGAIHTAQKLMAGQVVGLKQQYEFSTGAHNFENMLTPAARQRLSGLNAAPAGAPAGGGAAQPQEGERRQFKQGWGVFHNGQWVPAGP